MIWFYYDRIRTRMIKLAEKWLHDINIAVGECPSNSAEVNPIEND